MKTWEYKIENISMPDSTDKAFIEKTEKFLLEIGSDGWELVSTIPTSQDEEWGITDKGLVAKNILLIFKRKVS